MARGCCSSHGRRAHTCLAPSSQVLLLHCAAPHHQLLAQGPAVPACGLRQQHAPGGDGAGWFHACDEREWPTLGLGSSEPSGTPPLLGAHAAAAAAHGTPLAPSLHHFHTPQVDISSVVIGQMRQLNSTGSMNTYEVMDCRQVPSSSRRQARSGMAPHTPLAAAAAPLPPNSTCSFAARCMQEHGAVCGRLVRGCAGQRHAGCCAVLQRRLRRRVQVP